MLTYHAAQIHEWTPAEVPFQVIFTELSSSGPRVPQKAPTRSTLVERFLKAVSVPKQMNPLLKAQTSR